MGHALCHKQVLSGRGIVASPYAAIASAAIVSTLEEVVALHIGQEEFLGIHELSMFPHDICNSRSARKGCAATFVGLDQLGMMKCTVCLQICQQRLDEDLEGKGQILIATKHITFQETP